MVNFDKNSIYNVLLTHLSGALSTLFFLILIINDSLEQMLRLQYNDMWIFYPRMFIGMLGYVISWYNAKMGGVLMLGSGLLMGSYWLNYGPNVSFWWSLLFFLSYFIPGIIILVKDFLKNKQKE
ncbi:MAG: hypothetical protein JEZ03_16720 [Bacteroidales bacterium]|nr:hypothetical protein [Bacteroidales bacterium]